MATVSGLNVLKKAGVSEVCSRTHISRDNIEALLAEEFAKFTPVQFQGFVSILEREYGIDLEALRAAYAESIPREQESRTAVKEDPFVISVKGEQKHKRNVTAMALLLAGAVAAALFVLFPSEPPAKIELNNTAIDEAQANMAAVEIVEETNTTQTVVDAVQEERQSEGSEMPEPMVRQGMTLYPRSRVWVGMIDTQSREHFTKTTDDPVVLDANRSWLVVTGHGLIDVECGERNTTYKQSDKLYFLYEDGECRVLDADEFKLRNQGQMW